jgi:peptide/nickel transport system permease protein
MGEIEKRIGGKTPFLKKRGFPPEPSFPQKTLKFFGGEGSGEEPFVHKRFLSRFLRSRFLSRNGLALAGALIVGLVSLVSLLAPLIAPHNPVALDVSALLQPPCAAHPFGTDALGRDVLSRMLYGGRISLWVGFVAVGLSVAIGLFLGLISGYCGGLVDEVVMRGVDIMLCFPSFFLILAVIAFLEPSLVNIMAVIGLTSWMGVARLVRAETLTLKSRDFVLAARVAGSGPVRILWHHILPNASAPVLVSATLGVAGAILIESSLSFLGLGVQPPTPSWGNMLMEGKEVLEIAPWLSIFPGLAILFTVLGYNLLGEGLRDALDPRLKQ